MLYLKTSGITVSGLEQSSVDVVKAMEVTLMGYVYTAEA